VPPQIKLKTADDIRLEMARLYRDARQGRIDPSDASRLVYVLAQLGKMIVEAPPPVHNHSLADLEEARRIFSERAALEEARKR
jgi:hypothetical protein